MESSSESCWVGIDVAKRHWDVALDGQSSVKRFPASSDGLAELLAWLQSVAPQLVCLEATGGCETALVDALHEQGIPLAVLNPRQIRDFARALGLLAKTDKIDALVIARFAAAVRPRPDEPTPENQQELRALRARRQQVVDMLTQEKNRLAGALNPHSRESIQQAVDFYQQQLQALDQQLKQHTKDNPEFQRAVGLLTSVPGVGTVTATGLIADLPELGTLNRGQAAKLVGLAPINRDSGTLRGKRMTGGGRASVRKNLFMATLVATRFNPVIKSHYQHLLQKGKPKMVALTACMRKLLLILNAILKSNSPWKTQLTS